MDMGRRDMTTTRQFLEPMISSLVDRSNYMEMSWRAKAAATARGCNPACFTRTVVESTTSKQTGANLRDLNKIRNLLEQSISLTKGIDKLSSPQGEPKAV